MNQTRILIVDDETEALLACQEAYIEAEIAAERASERAYGTPLYTLTISSACLPDPCTEPAYPPPRNRRLKGHQRHEQRPFYHGVRRK